MEKLNSENTENLSGDQSSTLKQVYITIKTTQKYHYPRLVILLETWVSLVRDNTWFFTDSDTTDPELMARTGDHLVVTNCSSSHHRLSLCCKMEAEFQYFLRSHKQWWCHFDDDNFVNVAALGQMLGTYDSDKPWYLGKTSTASPLKIMTMDRKVKGFAFDKNNWNVKHDLYPELLILVCYWWGRILCFQDFSDENGSVRCVS